MRTRASVLYVAAITALITTSVQATDKTWVGSDGGLFFTGGNWSPSGIPGSSDAAIFANGAVGSTYDIDFSIPNFFPPPAYFAGNFTVDRVIVATNPLNFTGVSGSKLTIDSTVITETGRGLIIGRSGTGTSTAVLTNNLQELNTVYGTLGSDVGSSGTLNVPTGTFSETGTVATYDLIIGRNGAGTITANGGDVSVAGDMVLGLNAGSQGTVNVSNANSTWTSSGGLTVGYSGNGTLNVTNGGTLNSGGLAVGSPFSGPGSGGGNGTLNVTSGGTLNTSGAEIGGPTATATVTGANSSWSVDGSLSVGHDGDGTLNISNGAAVSAVSVHPSYVGNAFGNGAVNVTSGGHFSTRGIQLGVFGSSSVSAITVSGAGSWWFNANITDTSLLIGVGDGIGTINIFDGGYFENNGPVDLVDGNVRVEGTSSRLIAEYTLHVGNAGRVTVSTGGTLSGGVSVDPYGIVKGNGNLSQGVVSDGIVAPGDSIGALHIINGGYTQHSSGKLQIELGGTMPDSEYDQLLVAGYIALDGTLQVSLVGPFAPAFGDAFNILDWGGTRTGQFASLDLPTLGGALVWDASQLYTTGVLSVVLAGDFNANGVVDAADYLVWRKGLGTIYTQNDHNVWRAHFGQTAGSSAASNVAVPEPATAAMLIMAAACWYRRQLPAA